MSEKYKFKIEDAIHLEKRYSDKDPFRSETACGKSVYFIYCWDESDKERVTCPACLKAMKGGEEQC